MSLGDVSFDVEPVRSEDSSAQKAAGKARRDDTGVDRFAVDLMSGVLHGRPKLSSWSAAIMAVAPAIVAGDGDVAAWEVVVTLATCADGFGPACGPDQQRICGSVAGWFGMPVRRVSKYRPVTALWGSCDSARSVPVNAAP